MGETRYQPEELRTFCWRTLESLGMPEEDARVVADSLVRADLEGAGSHGISRLAIYAKRLREGRFAIRPEVRVERLGSVLWVDGGNGLGQVASCILVLVVHNAANMGATDRFLLGPGFAKTAAKHPSSRPAFGGARTVAGANARLLSKPASARPGLREDDEGETR